MLPVSIRVVAYFFPINVYMVDCFRAPKEADVELVFISIVCEDELK